MGGFKGRRVTMSIKDDTKFNEEQIEKEKDIIGCVAGLCLDGRVCPKAPIKAGRK